MKKLYISDIDKKFLGVCSGIGQYFGIDSTLIRLAFVLITLIFCGIPIVFYFIAWILMPREPGHSTIDIKKRD